MAFKVVVTLLNERVNVVIYVKNLFSDNVSACVHIKRIKNAITAIPTQITSKSGTLTVYTYDTPALIKAVMIENYVLAIASYMYEHAISSALPELSNNSFDLSGHYLLDY